MHPLQYIRLKFKQLLRAKVHPVLSHLRGPSLNCLFHHRCQLLRRLHGFRFSSRTACSSWLHASHHLLLNFAGPKAQQVSSHFANGHSPPPPDFCRGKCPGKADFPDQTRVINCPFQCREHYQETISYQVKRKRKGYKITL